MPPAPSHTSTPRRTRRGMTCYLLSITLLVLWLAPVVSADITVTLIDVGQGDAIWIHDDSGFDALVDAGPASAGETIINTLSGVPDLDVVLWTHAHADHIGGLEEVVSHIPVRQAYYNGMDYNSATFNDLLDTLHALQIPLATLHKGDALQWGESTVRVLHPDRAYRNTNDNSLVLLLRHQNRRFLLTGDAEHETENALLASGLLVPCDVLKVGHHGSISSSSSAFLRAVQPQWAIISVGENRYGHPSQTVLKRLQTIGATTLRTDLHGTIRLWDDVATTRLYCSMEHNRLYVPIVVRPIPQLRTALAPIPFWFGAPYGMPSATRSR